MMPQGYQFFLIVLLWMPFCVLQADTESTYEYHFSASKMKNNHRDKLYSGLVSSDLKLAYAPKSYLVVEASTNIGPTRTIEAMEIKSVSRSKISFQLSNKLNGQKEKLTFTYNLSVDTKEDLNGEVIDQFLNDQKAIAQLSSLLDEFEEMSRSDCDAYTTILDPTNDKINLFDKYILSEKLQSLNICNNELESVVNNIEEAYLTSVCEQILFESQILINSNDPISHRKAVNMLIKIPPKAPCRSEAIKVSEDLRKNTALQRSEQIIIDRYIGILKDNPGSWSSQF